MGTASLKARNVNSSEKLYFLPNSVYCAAVTRFCNTSRCASIGLFFQASMRHIRIRASDDMAGLSNFIEKQNKVTEINIKRRYYGYGLPGSGGKPGEPS